MLILFGYLQSAQIYFKFAVMARKFCKVAIMKGKGCNAECKSGILPD